MKKGLYPKFDIYSVDFDGKNRERLTNLESHLISDLSISGKRRLVVFNREDHGIQSSPIWIFHMESGLVEPFIINLMPHVRDIARKMDLSAVELLNESRMSIYDMAVSPDGNVVAFAWSQPYGRGYYGHEIYLANLKTKHVDQITEIRTNWGSPLNRT